MRLILLLILVCGVSYAGGPPPLSFYQPGSVGYHLMTAGWAPPQGGYPSQWTVYVQALQTLDSLNPAASDSFKRIPTGWVRMYYGPLLERVQSERGLAATRAAQAQQFFYLNQAVRR